MKISVATEMAKAAELEHWERSGSWEMIFLTRATEMMKSGGWVSCEGRDAVLTR